MCLSSLNQGVKYLVKLENQDTYQANAPIMAKVNSHWLCCLWNYNDIRHLLYPYHLLAAQFLPRKFMSWSWLNPEFILRKDLEGSHRVVLALAGFVCCKLKAYLLKVFWRSGSIHLSIIWHSSSKSHHAFPCDDQVAKYMWIWFRWCDNVVMEALLQTDQALGTL